MKKIETSLILVVMVLALAHCAGTQQSVSTSQAERPGAIAVEAIEMTGKVKAIDTLKRTVTIIGENGRTVTLNAKNARNFDQIKVGDTVRAEYVEEIAVFVRKAGAPPEAQRAQVVALAPKGKMPGGVVAETTEIEANVESIDYIARTVTLRGPAGGIQTIKVGPQVKNLEGVNKGDQVVLRITEAVALEVTRP